MTIGLTAAELDSLQENGYWGPFEVYKPQQLVAEVKALRSALADRSRAAYEANLAGNIANYDRHLDIAFLDAHIRRSAIVDRVQSVLGSDLVCWRTEFFVKYPGDEGTDWHQSRNLAIGGGKAPLIATRTNEKFKDVFLTLSVWTAFTDATLETSCLQLIPGSHKHVFYDESKPLVWRPSSINKVFKGGIKRGFFGYDTREIHAHSEWDPPEERAVSFPMRAGQSMIFWEATMHSSLPNISLNRTRMAFVVRYVPTHVRIYSDMPVLKEYGGTADLSRWRAVLVSGSDEFKFNRY